jgi:predicted DNA-binding transcriptional regulator AlpA
MLSGAENRTELPMSQPTNASRPSLETGALSRKFAESTAAFDLDDLRMLTMKEVQQIVRYSRATIYRKIHSGEFPPGILLGPHRRVWPYRDIKAFVEARIKAGHGFARLAV